MSTRKPPKRMYAHFNTKTELYYCGILYDWTDSLLHARLHTVRPADRKDCQVRTFEIKEVT